MRFTNYLLPLESSTSKSHYLTAYSSINVTSQQERAIATTVAKVNQLIRLRLVQLSNGLFNSVDLDWEIPHMSVIHLSDITRANVQTYKWGQIVDEYIPLMKKQMPTFNASILNKNFEHWPQSFKTMNHEIRSEEYHVSLLPLIRYPKDNLNTAVLINKFMTSIRKIGKFQLKTSGKLSLFAKWDMKKIFLGLEIEQNEQLTELINILQDFRLSLPDCGIVVGENDGCIIDWVKATPHISIGVWNSHAEQDSIDLNGNLFGFWELLYLNDILLKSSYDLGAKYPHLHNTNSICELPMGPEMVLSIDTVTLIANGQRLRQRLT